MQRKVISLAHTKTKTKPRVVLSLGQHCRGRRRRYGLETPVPVGAAWHRHWCFLRLQQRDLWGRALPFLQSQSAPQRAPQGAKGPVQA